jgi:predicted MFS family arabinose efflux permease
VTSWRIWLAVAALGVGSFAIVTTELSPIGFLSEIAQDFGRSENSVGLIVTVYAWVAAVAALVSATTLGRLPRKPLLIGLMLVLASSSAVATQTSTLQTLLGARIIGALAHGVFWAMIGSLGAQIAPPRHVGLATSIIFGGISAASVLGVPLANTISHIDGWRYAFGVVSILAFASAAAIALSVPRVPGMAPFTRDALKAIARDPVFLRIYVATGCAVTAHCAAFTYIEPFLSQALRVPAHLIGVLLLVFGLAGLVGNIVTGVLIDRHLKLVVLASLALMGACLFGLGLLGPVSGVLVAAVLLFGWGIAVAAVFVGFQTWLLREAGEASLPASAIYVAIFNGSIGTGALLGSGVISVSNLNGLMIAAGVALFASLLPVIVLRVPDGANRAGMGQLESETGPGPAV